MKLSKLKLFYFRCIMQRPSFLYKALMLEKVKGKERIRQPAEKRLNSIWATVDAPLEDLKAHDRERTLWGGGECLCG